MSKIANKFIFTASAILILATLLFLGSAIDAIRGIGRDSLNQQTTILRNQSYNFLRDITRIHAEKYEEKRKQVVLASTILARQTGFLLRTSNRETNPLAPSARIPMPFDRFPLNEIYYHQNEPVTTIYWGSETLPPERLQEMQHLRHLHPTFIEVVEEIPAAIASHIITQSGIGVYCSLEPATQNPAHNLPHPSVYDLRMGEPFTAAGPEHNLARSTIWTRPYKDSAHPGLSVTASTPYYDSQGHFAGIAGVDIPIDRLASDIFSTPPEQPIKSLFSFLLDDQGLIIALSPENHQTLGLSPDLKQLHNSSDILNFNLAESTHKTIQDATTQILATSSGITPLVLKNQTYLLAHQKMIGTNWILCKMLKEDELLTAIPLADQSITATSQSITKRFLTISIIITIMAIGLIVLVFHYLTQPIQRLIMATREVEKGNLTLQIYEPSSHDELGQLSTSFNTMIQGLAKSQKKEQLYARQLEKTVSSRTSELQRTNTQLNETLDTLLTEVAFRREKEQELYHYERIISATGDMIALVNKNYVYEVINDAYSKAFGKQSKEIVGHTIAENIGQKRFDQFVRPIVDRCLTGETVAYQDWYDFNGQEYRQISVVYDPYYTLDNKLYGAVISVRDINDIKEAEEQTLAAQQQMVHSGKMAAMGRLVAGISHEMNNGVNFITGALSPLKRQLAQLQKDPDNEQARDNVDILTGNIEEGSRRLVHIISSLTTFSRKGSKQSDLIDINREIQTLLPMILPESPDIRITQHLHKGMPLVSCVPEELGQAIVNILLNSIQALNDRGEIEIRTQATENHVHIIIHDNGPGIPAEHMDKIFEPFYTTKLIGDGTGLGLSICHDIISKFGGTITVNSTHDTGTTFDITLPVAKRS
ncbi:MAG: PAS domain S-box protein [Desulfobulbaceae bacterium]|uniref:histidine kinase n=1 Tax=Candidatus Desulfatifera sulfidica TaxID=2841691 RepID=A0A8J6TE25_9BACT|nr:PAS domain S-box protein [Candidatus Desulfatifera sulfidica]